VVAVAVYIAYLNMARVELLKEGHLIVDEVLSLVEDNNFVLRDLT